MLHTLTLPNFLSLLRIPLALAFLQENPLYRLYALLIAMATDGLDGYLARKWNQSSKFGSILDPLTDKFFVFVVLMVFLYEKRLNYFETFTLLCRDCSVIIFGAYLMLNKRLKTYPIKAIWSGKITTALQFVIFLLLTIQYPVPEFAYFCLLTLGIAAFFELFLTDRFRKSPSH